MYQRTMLANLLQYCFKGFAIILIGPRQVGKTTLVKALANTLQKKHLYFNCDEPDVKRLFETINLTNLTNIITDADVIIIDEAQRVENIGIAIKLLVDNFPNRQFIITGSSALEIANNIFEPLTGRQLLFHLYPLTITEMYSTTNVIETNRQIHWHLIYGCYPKLVMQKDLGEIILKNLVSDYLYKDVLAWKDIRKPDLLNKLLLLLALQIGNEISLNELAVKLKVSTHTVETYIDLLEKCFVVFRLSAYSTNERKEVTKMKKIYFWDNGIRNAIIGSFIPVSNRTDVGALWENFVISERLKYNSYNQTNVQSFFWRSKQQQEIDYVEQVGEHLFGYECKWNAASKGKPTKAFGNLYPHAQVAIINNENYHNFLLLP